MARSIPLTTERDRGGLARGTGVERFKVEVALANNEDLALAEAGFIDTSKVRQASVAGYVDSGVGQFVLPSAVVDRLGLPESGKVEVRFADHRTAVHRQVGNVYLEWEDRHDVFAAIVDPGRDTAVLGRVVLEKLDLIIDASTGSLRRRHPRFMIAEL